MKKKPLIVRLNICSIQSTGDILQFQMAMDFLEHYFRLSLFIAPTRFALAPRPLSRTKQPILLPSSSGVNVLLHHLFQAWMHKSLMHHQLREITSHVTPSIHSYFLNLIWFSKCHCCFVPKLCKSRKTLCVQGLSSHALVRGTGETA